MIRGNSSEPWTCGMSVAPSGGLPDCWQPLSRLWGVPSRLSAWAVSKICSHRCPCAATSELSRATRSMSISTSSHALSGSATGSLVIGVSVHLVEPVMKRLTWQWMTPPVWTTWKCSQTSSKQRQSASYSGLWPDSTAMGSTAVECCRISTPPSVPDPGGRPARPWS